MAPWQSGNAVDCKSIIERYHRFESDRRLHHFNRMIQVKYQLVSYNVAHIYVEYYAIICGDLYCQFTTGNGSMRVNASQNLNDIVTYFNTCPINLYPIIDGLLGRYENTNFNIIYEFSTPEELNQIRSTHPELFI